MATIDRGLLLVPLLLGLAACDGGMDATTAGDSGGGSGGNLTTVGPGDDAPTIEERLLLCEESKPASCPGNNDDGLTRHKGLVDGAICQYTLVDQELWASEGAIVDAIGEDLPLVSARELLGDLDRQGVRMEDTHDELARLELMKQAFGWDAKDHADKAWMPQGVSGSADATDDETIGGRKVVAVSWYNKPEYNTNTAVDKGSRISFVDVTDLDAGKVSYTHALLVDPYDNQGQPDFRPVRIHVGGIAWVGDYLYAVDTVKGLRVFDTTRLIKLDSLDDEAGYDPETGKYRAYGHRYAIPQVGAYFLSDESCWHRFSFISLDKTADVPSLITGEFHGTDIAGKLMRWPLDGQRLAATDPATGATQPYDVFFAQESDMQGGASIRGEWYMSSSGQDGSWGKLYRAAPGQASEGYGWVIGPEDLMVADGGNTLWSASEFAGRRYVFSVDVGGY
ncbi:MAG: hypothetical protein H6711_19910 [Myxococcales bacterium]|nr:hypothetical protein [Myxococcales bacterium]